MRIYILLIALCLHIAVRGQTLEEIDLSGLPQPTQAKSLRYWFDDDVSSVQIVPAKNGVDIIDAASLTEGLHTLYCQVIGNDGSAGYVASGLFMKTGDNASSGSVTASKLMYWFDDETNIHSINASQGVQMLDASDLIDGLHTIHYQVLCNNGMMTPAMSSIFLRMNPDSEAAIAKSLRYWFDDDKTSVKVVDVTNGTQMLDVSNMLAGLHTLYCQTVDKSGKVGPPVAKIFYKDFNLLTEDGNNRITRYQYWMNDNSADMQTVALNNAANPYQLIGLLPMKKEQIRSLLFHFEVTNGVPAIYAKNVFHIRFHDAKTYFVDEQKPFIDYSVKQTVEPVGELQEKQTFNRIAENAIRWYTVSLEPGDTVAFKTSQACSIQLFAPSGKEVYSAMGSTSVAFGGCHAWESGTYYLAIHDVMGSQSQMTLDYMHMDKYDVVRQDVSVVGNGGCSTITFEGNGFRDLYAVDLIDGQGNTIEQVYIGHESDATTSVVFDFTDAELGTYDALFHFADGDKVFTNLVTVEKAKNIELTTIPNHASQYLRGSTTSYSFNVENKGNMTAFSVPIYAYISSETLNGISSVRVKGLKLKNLYDYMVNIESENTIDNSYWEEMREICNLMGDDHYFNKFATTDEQTGDSIIVRSGFFTIDLPPKTSKTIVIEIQSTERIEVWLTIPEEWHSIVLDDNNVSTSRNKSASEWLCCYHERLECIGTIIVDVADVVGMLPIPQAKAATVISCVTGAINQTIKSTANVLCNEENVNKSFYEKITEIANGISITGTILTCTSGLVKAEQLKELLSCLSLSADAITHPFAAVDCIIAWSRKKPNCPPNPPIGGSSIPVNSRDPNDIYGYTAESGSKAIKNGQTDVYYTIEFENDPEFATASAHDIYLTNTLDATKFDLSTFKPTRINIGGKSAELSGDKNFVTTIDMRPEINAIAQVEGTYDEKTGTARWHISSLDPMTMEPTEEVMDGVLPVNYGGNGIGEVMYDIQLKPGLAHQTKVSNQASIVFDKNEAIQTPVWTNIIDRIAPTSHATEAKMLNDSTAAVGIAATDELSGPWRYDVYVQYGDGAWFLGAENVPIDQKAKVKVYQGINHGFYTVVTDSAGNVEQKQTAREFTLDVFSPQIETTTKLQLAAGWNWISQNQNAALSAETLKPKAQRIVSQTEELYKDARLGWSGDLTELQPTEMYKVQMSSTANVQLSGLLYNASFRTVPLRKGWNWMGYPVAKTMTPTEALAKLEAEEDDALIGQDGMAQYSGGQWTGTLTTLQPGQGYMYRSASDKELFLNATAQASSRSNFAQSIVPNPPTPEDWTVDKHRYPNVMGIVADLYRNGQKEDANDWTVGAFAGEECRGVAQNVDGRLMMNVYGQGGEQIVFRAMYRESGEVVPISEQEAFRADLLGSVSEPYQLTIGTVTGIVDNERMRTGENEERAYDLQGRRVKSQTSKGIYIVTDGKKSRTQKVVK